MGTAGLLRGGIALIVTPDRTRDRNLLYAAAFLRAAGTGMMGILIGLYLARRGMPASTIGIVVTAGLSGAAFATLIATLKGDRLGRRRFLVALALLGAAGSVAFLGASSEWMLAACAFLGMLNGMGRDRGAALALEQAMLPATTTDDRRTQVIAWYNVLQDSGHAIGSLMAALPAVLHQAAHLDEITAIRAALGLYAVLMAATLFLYAALSPSIEEGATAPVLGEKERARVTPETRRILWRLGSLFALDSLGGGFLTAALLSYFFFQRFGVGEGTIGALFFGARVMNAFSHLGAAWLAKRIGLVNTMVFTHIPSSILLATVAFAPTFPVAAILFLLREGLVEMDVPTRQSYVMAVVKPEERTFASGVTHLIRMGAWAVAPGFAGWMMQGSSSSLAVPLFVGAGMKITYDVLLYFAFRRQHAPEERARMAAR